MNNEKINWRQKLSSRKFWALLAALIVSVLTGIVSPDVASRVVGIVTAVGACVTYMLAEASVDKSRDISVD